MLRRYGEDTPEAPAHLPIPATVLDCMAGCHAQHQQTAFAKKTSHDAMVFVKSAPAHLPIPAPSLTAWQDAMRSTSKLRLPRKHRTMRWFS
jgi:hypothetical protein